jgi:hypothetical protein
VFDLLRENLTGEADSRSRAELEAVEEVCDALARTEDPVARARLLSDFATANPQLVSRLALLHVDTYIDFVAEVCAHYAAVKEERPLTPQEKALGNKLLDILAIAKEHLASLKEKDRGGTP